MRKFGIVLSIFVASFFISIGLSYWFFYAKPIAIPSKPSGSDLLETQQFIHKNQLDKALALITKHANEIESSSEDGKKWLDLFITVSEGLSNTPQLVVLYEYDPKAFENHEKGLLMVATAYLSSGKDDQYNNLRQTLKDSEAQHSAWKLLDADYLLSEGKHQETIALLSSQTFEGKAEVDRLTRLALLTAPDQPKDAWNYLGQAFAKDPTNPEIRLYRGKLLESIGKKSYALTEYIAAAESAPKNFYLKDQLAEFYIRQKNYEKALHIWQDALVPPSLDIIWEKAWFWSHMVKPISFDWHKTKPPAGSLLPYVDYLINLSPTDFWNDQSFEKLSKNSEYLKAQQSSFWLRLLQALKIEDEAKARDLLFYNPFNTSSWDPALERALKRILNYRKTGSFVIEGSYDAKINEKDLPDLFAKIEALASESSQELKKIPPELDQLLLSNGVYSATFLAAGWTEASIQLYGTEFPNKNFVDWVTYDFTEALRINRGNMEALEFAVQQKPFPKLSLLIGELLLAEKNFALGLDVLSKVAPEHSDIGVRASWLISLSHMDKGEFLKAKDVIKAQPLLVHDVLGQETLAKIALLEGDAQLADTIYSKLEKHSIEAKSYLAKRAFEKGHWDKARQLTQDLLIEYPNDALLMENLKKIIKKQKG